jgi:MFS family permease
MSIEARPDLTEGVTGSGAATVNSAYGWVIVAITFLAIGLVFGSRFSLGLFLPHLPQALDTSAGAISAAFAVSMLGAAIVQPLTGLLLDRWGGRVVLSIGLGFAALGLCGTAFASSVWQLTLFMGLASSIAYAAVSPASITSIVSSWFDRNRGTALGIATSGTKVAMIFLPPAVAALIFFFGWRTAMLALGLIVCLLIPAVLVFVKPAPGSAAALKAAKSKSTLTGNTVSQEAAARPAGAPTADATLWKALKIPSFWVIAISLFANGFIMNLVFIHLPSFVLSQGYDEALAATGLAVLGAVGIIGNVVTGSLSDRLGRRTVLMIMFGARGITTLYLVLSPGPVSLVAFVIVFGLLGYGAIGVIGALASDLFGQRSIGTILGSAYVFNQVGAAVGVYAGGASLEWTGDYSASLWLSALTTVLSLLCLVVLRGENRSVSHA